LSDRKTKIAVIAVEDREVLLAVAEGSTRAAKRGGRSLFTYETVSEPIRIPRSGNHYDHLRDGGRGFTDAVLLPLVADFIDRLGSEPDIIGISTFGTIDPATNILRHTGGQSEGADKEVRRDVLDIAGSLKRQYGIACPVIADNDATTAAFGEYLYGAGSRDKSKGDQAFAFAWAGRGLNAGFVIDGRPWQGRLHPEMGHLPARRFPDDPHEGNCGSHKDCLTGLAGLRAFEQRAKRTKWTRAQSLDATAYYIAQLCTALTFTVAPTRICVGGLSFRSDFGSELFGKVMKHYRVFVADYPGYSDEKVARNVIIPSQLGDQASLLGVMEIARMRVQPDTDLQMGDVPRAAI